MTRPGTGYEKGRFVLKNDDSTLEEDSKITLGDLTQIEVIKSLNAKNQHIQFTAKKPDDYLEDNSNIPLLDFKIGISVKNGEYILMFYEKKD